MLLAACLLGAAACEAVLGLGDVVSCGDCVGTECPASCADTADGGRGGEAASPDDATAAEGGPDGGGAGDGGDGRLPSALLGSIDGGGRVLWMKTWGAQSADGVVVDGEGNTYVLGTLSGTVAFGDAGTLAVTGTASDVYLAKIDPSGETRWVKDYGGNASEVARSLALDPSGDLYIVGDFQKGSSVSGTVAPDASALSSFVAKVTGDGTPVWAFALGSPGDTIFTCRSVAVGGPSAQPIVAVTCWFDGNTLVFPDGGVANQDQTFDGGTKFADGCLVGVAAATGMVSWANPIGGAQANDFLYSVAAEPSGDFVVAGTVVGNPLTIGISAIPPPAHVGKNNFYGLAAGFSATNGAATWARLYGDPEDSLGSAHFEVVAAGDSGADFFGGLVSQQAELGPGGAVTVPAGATGAVCMRLNVDAGEPTTAYVQTSGSVGSTSIDNLTTALAVDPAGDLFCAGTLAGRTAFSGDYDLAWPADGGTGAFVAKVGASGETLWAYGLGSAGASDEVRPESAAVAPDGTFRVVGAWQGSVTFDTPRESATPTAFVLALGP